MNNTKYYWRVNARNAGGTTEFSQTWSFTTSLPPGAYSLYQNYPNPFNPTTRIRYDLPEDIHVTLNVFDLLGKKVAALVDANEPPGTYEVMLDGANLADGAYFVEFRTGRYRSIQRILLLK